jgi:tetratricopeptide (TPR) repeat protein
MTLANRGAAIRLYETLVEKYPNSSTAWYAKGLALTRLKLYDQAMDCFDRALSIDKNYAVVWYAKGLALTRLKLYDQAMDCFRTSIKNNPKAAGGFKGHTVNVANNK